MLPGDIYLSPRLPPRVRHRAPGGVGRPQRDLRRLRGVADDPPVRPGAEDRRQDPVGPFGVGAAVQAAGEGDGEGDCFHGRRVWRRFGMKMWVPENLHVQKKSGWNTSTKGSLPQKCFREVQPRSFWMAGDPRTQGPGAGNLPAANLQWKNGVGSDPALRPRPPSADCFEEGGPLTPGCEWRLRACTCRTLLRGTPFLGSVKVQEPGPQIVTGDPRE